jgi:hypothetical protein
MQPVTITRMTDDEVFATSASRYQKDMLMNRNFKFFVVRECERASPLEVNWKQIHSIRDWCNETIGEMFTDASTTWGYSVIYNPMSEEEHAYQYECSLVYMMYAFKQQEDYLAFILTWK